MRGHCLALIVTLSACCAAPQVTTVPETAFVAEVVRVYTNGDLLVQPEKGSAVVLTGAASERQLGERVYVTGALTAPNRVVASSVQSVP